MFIKLGALDTFRKCAKNSSGFYQKTLTIIYAIHFNQLIIIIFLGSFVINGQLPGARHRRIGRYEHIYLILYYNVQGTQQKKNFPFYFAAKPQQ